MCRLTGVLSLLALLVAGCGAPGPRPAGPAEPEPSAAAVAAGPASPTEPGAPAAKKKARPGAAVARASLRQPSADWLDGIRADRAALDRLLRNPEGLIVIEHYERMEPPGDVTTATKYCGDELAARRAALVERLAASLERGDLLGDYHCRDLRCSSPGMDNVPSTYLYFTHAAQGELVLEAIVDLAEAAMTDRYVARAWAYADEELGRLRAQRCGP